MYHYARPPIYTGHEATHIASGPNQCLLDTQDVVTEFTTRITIAIQ